VSEYIFIRFEVLTNDIQIVAIWCLTASILHRIRTISEVYCIINRRTTIRRQF